MRNILESDDFGVVALTEAINLSPVVPNEIGSLNLFREEGITTTSVAMEQMGGTLKLIPAASRGTMPNAKTQPKRTLRAISVPHLPLNDTILADSLQGVRSFGQDQVQGEVDAMSAVIQQRLDALRQDHETTWEYHRIGALQGKILDADGTSVLVDLFAEFSVARLTVNWVRGNIDGLTLACMALIKSTKTEAASYPVSGIQVLCGEDFWEYLVTSTETKDAFKLFQDNAFARNQTFDAFVYKGVTFRPKWGGVGNIPFVPVAEGASFPLAPIYRRWNAPAPFNETVNTLGKPLYAKQKMLDFDTGVELHTNSNPLHVCIRPTTLHKMTTSA